MTNEEAKDYIREWCPYDRQDEIIKALSNSDEDMTVEKYRTRLMEVFHNADCSELITFVCLPTEEEFENLEYLLKNHYKNKSNSGEDCISREYVLSKAYSYGNGLEPDGYCVEVEDIQDAPSIQPKAKVGHWIKDHFGQVICSECNGMRRDNRMYHVAFCNKCGAKMEGATE